MFDQITIDRIELMHPVLREQLKKDYLEINRRLAKGIRLRFSQTFRTVSEQNELYAQGRTKKGNIVTNARGGSSFHNYGLAFDIVILYDKDGNGTFETASWNEKTDFDKNGKAEWIQVVEFFKSKGWKWGGDFRSFRDSPHFEMTFGKTVSQLQKGGFKNGFPII